MHASDRFGTGSCHLVKTWPDDALGLLLLDLDQVEAVNVLAVPEHHVVARFPGS